LRAILKEFRAFSVNAWLHTVLYRIGAEERMLTHEFGDEYLEYTKHTKKLILFVYCRSALRKFEKKLH
jgi:protein-S-isoprenylcysteine O-methyltransferase Ste14